MSTLLAPEIRTIDSKPLPSGRVAALDGFRGIAILLVLFDHIHIAIRGSYEYPWMQTGQHGVTIFFVLSGFLITSNLLEGPINLKRFYVRRFFRLMPAAWAYLAVLLLLNRFTGVSFTSWPEIRSCLFFYRNMVDVPGPGLAGHFWSLSLEEQFYLVWPCLLLLAGARRGLWIAVAGASSCALYRWFFWSHYDRLGPNDMSQVRADALLVGCVAALLLSNSLFRQIAVRWSTGSAIAAAAMLFYCMRYFHWLPPLRESISIAILISAVVLRPEWLPAKVLSWRPLAWLGIVSYSVYLWQELFVHLGVSSLAMMPVFALGSYYLIERPLVRLGKNYARNV